jgi:16S rRNA (uracil1498-N3)-methyltransferase
VSLQRLIVEPSQIVDDQLHLTDTQQHYLWRVLRLQAGDQFLALDGKGHLWTVALTEPDQPTNILTAQTVTTHEKSPAITLAVALPKGNGFDEVVRQTTELGVTALQPLLTERTLHKPNPKKVERWQRIAAEATEQSERLLLPHVHAPLSWADYLKQVTLPQRLLCVARSTETTIHLGAALQQQPRGEVVIAIGPEGGWTDTEIAAAVAHDFQPVSLGSHILRAVTAPLVALAMATAVREGLPNS